MAWSRGLAQLLQHLFVALTITFACAGGASAAPNGNVVGTVRGFVTTPDGVPIADAVLSLTGNGPNRVVHAGAKGDFVFGDIPVGTYAVRATARGYDAVSGRAIEVGADRVTALDLVMTRTATSLLTIGQVRANAGQSLATSSAATTTMNAQAYAAQGYTLLSDVLQDDISTTLVHSLGGSSALPTSVALRGPDPTETLVDIDGHQVNSGNSGDFDLSLLDPADYSDIELVRGISPSSLVGPDTIDGAINIRTIDPTADFHGLLRLSGGSFGALGETVQATGALQPQIGYAVSLHRTTTNGEVNQSVVDASTGNVERVGSAVDGSTALAKARYSFGRADGYLALSVRDQSQYRDLSAALSSIPSAGGSDFFGGPHVPVVNSFVGTSLLAHNAGYGLDARLPLGRSDANGTATTYALVRHYTSFVSQSVSGPGADTSPYLYNDRDLIGDNSLEVDHDFASGTISLQYGLRNETLDTDFAPGVAAVQSIVRKPSDDTPRQSSVPQTSVLRLGQTQRTAALRYIGDVNAKLHIALAVYWSKYSSFGTSLDPRTGFTWTPTAQSAIRASIGTTFQAPQLPELIVPPMLPPPVGGIISIGNPNLQPDRATEYSVGFEHVFSPGAAATNFSADVYRVNLRTPSSILIPAQTCGSRNASFIVRRSAPTPATTPPPCLSYPVNAGDAVYQGIEIQVAHQLRPFTNVRAGYAVRSAYLTNVPPYIQDGTLVVGEQSLGLPLQKATLTIERTPPSGIAFAAGFVYEGRYNELNQPPYAVLNASLGYRFRNFEIRLSGTNLTNQYDGRFTRLGAGVPYGGVSAPIPTDAYALQGTAFTLSLTQAF